MDVSFDVFAGVNDFCENYTPDAINPLEFNVSVDKEASDSEAETFFLDKKTNKPKKQTKVVKTGRSKRGGKAKSASNKKSSSGETASEESNEEPSPPKQSKTRNKDDDHISEVEEVIIEDDVNAARPKRITRRPTRLVEEYMQRQTAAILEQQSAVVPNRRRGRSRKDTSRSGATQVIDLAGPKTPPLPKWSSSFAQKPIIIGSDDDSATDANMNSSFDLEHEAVSVKVKWGDQIEVVPLRKHQKFADLMIEFAKKKNVDAKDILLNLDERIIGPNDTPDSINYNIAQFISGRIVPNANHVVPAKKKDPNMIKVKIQSNAFKKPLSVELRKDQPFKDLYSICVEELKISRDQIKLSFDGDQLMLTETPNDLDLEGGEVIDCRITQK